MFNKLHIRKETLLRLNAHQAERVLGAGTETAGKKTDDGPTQVLDCTLKTGPACKSAVNRCRMHPDLGIDQK